MNRHGLAFPNVRPHWIEFILMVIFVLCHVLVTNSSGTYYRAIYISKAKQVQDNLTLFNLSRYLHKCSMTSNCNYIVENEMNAIKMYNSRSEISVEEELLGIWMKIQSHYEYKTFMEKRDWHEARRKCQLYGGDLASITSKEEEEKIIEVLSSYADSDRFWIGLNDIVEEGIFVWSDRSESSLRSWGTGEPNNLGNSEDCTEIGRSTKWNDAPCHLKRYVLCKKLVT